MSWATLGSGMVSSGTQSTSSSQSSGYSSSLGTGLRATNDARENMLSQMEFNSAEAAAQRKWNEYMSNTSWQRTVKDMMAAGINPIYAVHAGTNNYSSGASASSGIAGAYTDYESANQSSSQSEMFNSFGRALEGLVGSISNVIDKLLGDGSSASSVSNFAKGISKGASPVVLGTTAVLGKMLKKSGKYY